MSAARDPSGEPFVASIPADVERPDKILAGLTARQVAIFAAAVVVVWLGYLSVGQIVPLPVFGVAAVVVVAAGAVLALGRRDGVSADRLLMAALQHALAPRRRVLAPEGIAQAPAWVSAAGPAPAPAPAPLDLPARAIGADGVIDLAGGGVVAVAEASTVSFGLRTPDEQYTLVAAFARWLNSLTAPVQVVVRAERVELMPLAAEIAEAAPSLPDPLLEQAAAEHAAFLAQLGSDNDLLRRHVLVVFTEPGAGRDRRLAAERVKQRLETAARALAAAEITVTALDGGQVAGLLATAANPLGPTRAADGWAAPGQVITGGGR